MIAHVYENPSPSLLIMKTIFRLLILILQKRGQFLLLVCQLIEKFLTICNNKISFLNLSSGPIMKDMKHINATFYTVIEFYCDVISTLVTIIKVLGDENQLLTMNQADTHFNNEVKMTLSSFFKPLISSNMKLMLQTDMKNLSTLSSFNMKYQNLTKMAIESMQKCAENIFASLQNHDQLSFASSLLLLFPSDILSSFNEEMRTTVTFHWTHFDLPNKILFLTKLIENFISMKAVSIITIFMQVSESNSASTIR
jgi:hypothetical protein